MSQKKPYDKLIFKYQIEVDKLKYKINAIDDFQAFRLLYFMSMLLFEKRKYNDLLSKIDDIYKEINQIRGRLRSAINTYTIQFNEEDHKSSVSLENNSNSCSSAYFTKIMNLLEQINIIENELEKKDIRIFLKAKNSRIKKTNNSDYSESNHINWDDYKLDV